MALSQELQNRLTPVFRGAANEVQGYLDTIDELSGAELGVLNEVTGGVVTASKAVVVDANLDIGSFRHITLTGTANVGNVAFAAAGDIDIPANTAAALEVDDGTTKILAADTRNTLKNIHTITITGVPVTVASEGAAHLNASLNLAAKTITYTGGTGTTSSLGGMLNVGVLTFTDASAMTLSKASAIHINAVAAAGGMLTITAAHMISTSVTDCVLTNAGVWTDMACWESGKEMVNRGVDLAKGAIDKVLSQITPATWKYKAMTELPGIDQEGKPIVHRTPINDLGRERVGIVYDDLPEALRAPGQETAVSTGVLASFNLAALKVLWERNQEIEARLARAGI